MFQNCWTTNGRPYSALRRLFDRSVLFGHTERCPIPGGSDSAFRNSGFWERRRICIRGVLPGRNNVPGTPRFQGHTISPCFAEGMEIIRCGTSIGVIQHTNIRCVPRLPQTAFFDFQRLCGPAGHTADAFAIHSRESIPCVGTWWRFLGDAPRGISAMERIGAPSEKFPCVHTYLSGNAYPRSPSG